MDANGWLPIESAPRDRRPILVWTGDDCRCNYAVVWYDEESGEWEDHAQFYAPTHWQPLPAPPVAAVERDDG